MVNSIKRWYFYSKMNFDGHYYALRHKTLNKSFLINQVALSMSSLIPGQLHNLIDLCRSFDTLVIDAYQTFSLMNFIKQSQLTSKSKDVETLVELERLFKELFAKLPCSFIEDRTSSISNDFNDWNYDYRIKNNSPHAFQIIFCELDIGVYMQLNSDYPTKK